jgi:hypothetical protein
MRQRQGWKHRIVHWFRYRFDIGYRVNLELVSFRRQQLRAVEGWDLCLPHEAGAEGRAQ